ncbi:hypothetical protein SI65_05105 [Aspergillus cristatus]|uniref:Uncharacterized protein n=1 Tax=Aspergillus cristatus TaxID=573508 RepID=A0A1E3BGU5_ASPCR|nr:hypothetical protein SI65_05105 [Aspergillus cristatus]
MWGNDTHSATPAPKAPTPGQLLRQQELQAIRGVIRKEIKDILAEHAGLKRKIKELEEGDKQLGGKLKEANKREKNVKDEMKYLHDSMN